MRTNHYGEMYFGKVIDVTDPCYNSDVWCRTSIDVVPGTYDCYATHTPKRAEWQKSLSREKTATVFAQE